MKNQKKKEKISNMRGITLIALVITIIVLLILAGITIAALSGNNGILINTTKSKEETEIANEKEQIEIASASSVATSTRGDITKEDMENNLVVKQGNNATVKDEGENLRIKFKDSGREYIVNKDSGEVSKEDINQSDDNISVGEKAEFDTTINGEKGTYNNPIIPKGFMAIDTETAKWNDVDGWKNGLVIEDATNDQTTSGSQFVWVPVKNYNDFHLIEGYYNKVLQSYLNISYNPISPSREAGSNNEEPYTPGKPNQKNTVKGTQESIEMYESVKENGGFYIAIYEAGINGTTESTTVNDKDKQIQDGSLKPVSKKGVGVWNCIQWSNDAGISPIDGLPGNDTKDGAVKVARSMYNNIYLGSNNADTNIKSTLCYGVQWDAVMNFINDNYISGTAEGYVKDSSERGNYSGKIEVSGSKENYAEKNIYDMAGNLYEWTMEAYDNNYRIGRGGGYDGSGNINSASSRGDNKPNDSYNNLTVGFRVALYI